MAGSTLSRNEPSRLLEGAPYTQEWYSATLAADLTLSVGAYPNLMKLDPGGSARNVLLPAEADSDGMVYHIVNGADGAENLVVKEDSATTTIVTINQNEEAIVACDGTDWTLIRVATIALS